MCIDNPHCVDSARLVKLLMLQVCLLLFRELIPFWDWECQQDDGLCEYLRFQYPSPRVSCCISDFLRCMPPRTAQKLIVVGVTPGLPHVQLADIEERLRHERAPPCAGLCEGGPLGEGERRAVRVRETNMLEVALERPAISHLLYALEAPPRKRLNIRLL